MLNQMPKPDWQQDDCGEYERRTHLPWGQILLLLVGMPVKLRQRVTHRHAWATWSLAGMILISSILVWQESHMPGPWELLVLRPDAQGLAWLSGLLLYPFVHGDWFHLLGNLYFLLLFGRNIECVFGRRRMLGLFFISSMLGGLLHLAFHDVGLIGASGGVFGLLVFYVLQFPKARVMWIPFGLAGRLLAISLLREYLVKGYPVWIYLLIFGAVQLLILWEQLFFNGQISALAHIGGGLAGACIWGCWRKGWLL